MSRDTAGRRAEALAILPGLLSLARQVLIGAVPTGDAEAVALKGLIEECVVGAHRIRLREQLAATLDGEGEAP